MKKKKTVKKRYRLKRFGLLYNLRLLLFILVPSVLLTSGYVYVQLATLHGEDLDHIALQLNTNAQKEKANVKNIALFGVDSRTEDYADSRSDSILVLSYNFDTKDVHLTSVARDTFVYVNSEYDYEKLNHAFSYGGPSLAVQTLNQNFDLDITDYIAVNFLVVEDIVNALGGVDIDIKDYELDELNRIIRLANKTNTNETETIQSVGTQTLDGTQAVSYMRIRKVGNGDYERMGRQREVISLTANKLLSANPFKLLSLIDTILPAIETSLTPSEMLDLGLEVVTNRSVEIIQQQIPYSEYRYNARLDDNLDYLIPNTLVSSVKKYHETIYDLETYTPSLAVELISQSIEDQTSH